MHLQNIYFQLDFLQKSVAAFNLLRVLQATNSIDYCMYQYSVSICPCMRSIQWIVKMSTIQLIGCHQFEI